MAHQVASVLIYVAIRFCLETILWIVVHTVINISTIMSVTDPVNWAGGKSAVEWID